MGKSQQTGKSSEATPQADTATTAAAEAAAKADGRHKKLTLKGDAATAVGKPEGTEVNRVDWIRDVWRNKKHDRSAIKKMLNAMGDNSPYQVVFQATKGVEGGPPKAAAQPAGDAAAGASS